MERILQSHAAAACNPCPQQRSPTAYKAKVISEINKRLRGRWQTLRVKTTGSIHSMSAFSASSAGSVSSAMVSPTQVSPPPESEWVPTPATPSSVLSQRLNFSRAKYLTVQLISDGGSGTCTMCMCVYQRRSCRRAECHARLQQITRSVRHAIPRQS